MLVIWYHIFLFSCMHSCIVHLHDCSTDYWLAESSTSWSDINICSSRSLSLPPVYYRVKAAPLNENSSVEMLWLWNPCYSSRRNLEKRSDLCRYAPRIPPPWLLLVLNLQRDKEHIGVNHHIYRNYMTSIWVVFLIVPVKLWEIPLCWFSKGNPLFQGNLL